MKISETINAARLRASVFLRERKERAAERKAAKQAAMLRDQHAHSRFWLLNVPAFATICAASVEWYWAVLFCLAATGRLAVDWATSIGSNVAPAGAWHFSLDIQNVAVLVGLVLATAPIVMLSMVWLPVQFAMRGAGRWRRGTLITVGILANLLVIVSGTVVMNMNRQGQVREALVTEQRGDAGRAAIVARRDAVHQRWVTLTEPSNTTLQAQAARAGVAGWDAYIATARQQAQAGTITPQRLALIERARGSAVAAEAYQAQEDALTGQIAAAAPAAATQAHVQDDVGAGMDWFAQRVEVYRPPFVALICTLIGIFGAWWTLAMLERLNPRDVLRSGWASEAERIEDLRAEEPVVPQPMKPAREVVTDAETGEEMVKVKPHWRKLKKGKPQRVDVTPEPEPDETGVPPELDGRDSALRAASEKVELPLSVNGTEAVGDRVEEQGRVVGGAEPKQDSGQEGARQSDQQEQREPDQPELSEQTYSSDDLDALLAPEPPVDAPDAEPESDASAGDDGEGEHSTAPTAPQETATDEPIEEAAMVNADPEQPEDREPSGQVKHHDPREEPETDPARLIAAVAAE